MYKSRLTKWGFDQKYKKRATSISRLANEQATRCENDPAIPPRRRPISSVEDQRFGAKASKEPPDPPIQRAKSSYPDNRFATGADESQRVASPNAQVESNANVNANATEKPSSCSLLTLKPSMQPPTILETSEIFEEFERELCRYFRTSFHTGLWIDEGQEKHCRSIKARDAYHDEIASFKNDLLATCHFKLLRGRLYQHEVPHRFNKRSEITDLVISESPELIADLIELSLRMCRRGRYDLVRIVLRQFADVSAVLNTKGHSIYRLLAQYATLDSGPFEEIASKGWRLIAEQFSTHLGCLHITAISCRLGWLTYFASSSVCDQYICLTDCQHEWYAETAFRELLKSCEIRASKTVQTEMVLKALLDFLLGRRSYAKIAEIYDEAMLHPPAHHAQSLRFLAVKAMSEASYYQEKLDQTEAYLRELVDISATAWGWKSSQTISSMLKLEKCLNVQGKSEEARETAEKALRPSGVNFGWAGFY
jgi:hypothetical protein